VSGFVDENLIAVMVVQFETGVLNQCVYTVDIVVKILNGFSVF